MCVCVVHSVPTQHNTHKRPPKKRHTHTLSLSLSQQHRSQVSTSICCCVPPPPPPLLPACPCFPCRAFHSCACFLWAACRRHQQTAAQPTDPATTHIPNNLEGGTPCLALHCIACEGKHDEGAVGGPRRAAPVGSEASSSSSKASGGGRERLLLSSVVGRSLLCQPLPRLSTYKSGTRNRSIDSHKNRIGCDRTRHAQRPNNKEEEPRRRRNLPRTPRRCVWFVLASCRHRRRSRFFLGRGRYPPQ